MVLKIEYLDKQVLLQNKPINKNQFIVSKLIFVFIIFTNKNINAYVE